VKKILLINGPNLNLLGTREPEIYGRTTLSEIEATVSEQAEKLGMAIKPYQSNHEGGIIDFIQAECDDAYGIIINPGAFTHYSYAIRDCLAGAGLPVVEVHISNLHKREKWRNRSVISEICAGMINGMGVTGYLLALEYFKDK